MTFVGISSRSRSFCSRLRSSCCRAGAAEAIRRATRRGRSRRAREARSDDQARHPLRRHQQLSRQARLQGVARVPAAAGRRSAGPRASRAGAARLRPADSRRLPAVGDHQAVLGHDVGLPARIRRRSVDRLEAQSRRRGRSDDVRPGAGHGGADAGRVRRDDADGHIPDYTGGPPEARGRTRPAPQGDGEPKGLRSSRTSGGTTIIETGESIRFSIFRSAQS